MHTVPGMRDVLPKHHDYFTFIKKVVRYHARRTGLKRISLPALVPMETLNTILGSASDTVQSGLFHVDMDGKDYAMRPDMTTGVIRACLTNELYNGPLPIELYYIDQVWRNAQIQEEALRQVHEYGFELIGEEDPALDSQLIHMCMNIFKDLGLANVKVRIAHVGTRAVQEKYAEDVRNFFTGKERALSESDVEKLAINPLRLLSSSNEDTKILAKLAPGITNVLDTESKEHVAKVKEYLDILDIPYIADDQMVMDADMYTHIVFRFEYDLDGKVINLGGGGRYNSVIAEMGGPHLPGVGASFVMEQIADLMTDIHLSVPTKDKLDVFVVQLGDDAKKVAVKLAADLRSLGIKTMGAMGKAAIRAQIETATRFDVKYALVLGQMEVREKKIIIRDMKKGTQEIIPFAGIIEHMVELLGATALDTQNFKAMIEETSDID